MSRMGGSFPVSDWMKEGVETRTERVKRLERERVLDEIEEGIGSVMEPELTSRAPADVQGVQRERDRILTILKELREGGA